MVSLSYGPTKTDRKTVPMNVANFILNIIRKLGTDTVFSLTGGMAMHINRAVAESGMQVVYCNHEQAVAAAADGYAKAKEFQIPGLAVVTSGPAVMNIVNSVASAHYDSVPVFILAGQVKTADINAFGVRSRGAQETPQLDVMKTITKCAFRYIPDQISDDQLAQNMAQAIAGRKGPVFIEFPLDMQALEAKDAENRIAAIVTKIHEIVRSDMSAESQAVAAITEALSKATRPAFVVGNGLHIAGISRDRVRALVEKIGAPALFTWPSSDLLDYEHDLYYGCAGGLAPTHANKVIQNADLLIFIGVRLDLLTTGFNANNYGKNAKRLIVECDQKEIDKNASIQNAVFFKENLINVIERLEKAQLTRADISAWLQQAREWRAHDRAEEQKAFGDGRFTTHKLATIISQSIAVNYIVPTGSGFGIEGFGRYFRPRKNVSLAWAGHCLGSMGLALPMAVGAAAALHQRIHCIEGDGGILLNVQELYTIAANPQLPVTIIIMNNGGYQSISKSQMRAFGKEFGASDKSGLCNPRFDLLAAAVGMDYIKCETPAQFKDALEKTKGAGRHIIDVMLEEDGYRGPAVQTKFDANGKPYSTDIGDVNWDR